VLTEESGRYTSTSRGQKHPVANVVIIWRI